MNEARNDEHFCADVVPTERDRLEALLRVAAAQWAHKSAADQDIDLRLIERDWVDYRATTQISGQQ